LRRGDMYMFSLGTDFTDVVVGHGLEARATAAKMAATRWYFARLNTYGQYYGGFEAAANANRTLSIEIL